MVDSGALDTNNAFIQNTGVDIANATTIIQDKQYNLRIIWHRTLTMSLGLIGPLVMVILMSEKQFHIGTFGAGSYTINLNANDSHGNEVSFTINITVSNDWVTVPPQNIQAKGSIGSINLSWRLPITNNGSAILGYNIYRGTSSGAERFYCFTGNYTVFTDTNVTNGQIYYYELSTINGLGEGPISTEVFNSTFSAHLGTPFNLTITIGDGDLILNWTAPLNTNGLSIIGYNIYRGTSSNNETCTRKFQISLHLLI